MTLLLLVVSTQAVQAASNTISNPILSNGQFIFTLNSASEQNYTIQFSTNLTNWVALFSSNLPGGSSTVTLTPAANQAGFYRAYDSGLVITDNWTGSFSSAPVVSFASRITNCKVTSGSAAISITRFGAFSGQVCVNYATTDGTAHAGIDYAPVSGTICFDPNQSNASILIPLIVTTNFPGTTKTVNVELLNAAGDAYLYSVLAIQWPSLVGIWSGSWSSTNVGIPGTSGTWTYLCQQANQVVIDNVPYPDFQGSGMLSFRGTDYPGTNINISFSGPASFGPNPNPPYIIPNYKGQYPENLFWEGGCDHPFTNCFSGVGDNDYTITGAFAAFSGPTGSTFNLLVDPLNGTIEGNYTTYYGLGGGGTSGQITGVIGN